MRWWWPLCTAALLSGCAALGPDPDRVQGGAARDAAAAALQSWTAVGRILIRTPKESWHATLRWRQTGERFHIRLIAPLGQGTVELRGNPGGVTLSTGAEGESRQARDPETLMGDTLGWRVPVKGLRYWIRGLPDPERPVEEVRRGPEGRIESLEQSGWSVRIPRYDTGSRPVLPAKLYLEHPRFGVRIVVTRWVTGAP